MQNTPMLKTFLHGFIINYFKRQCKYHCTKTNWCIVKWTMHLKKIFSFFINVQGGSSDLQITTAYRFRITKTCSETRISYIGKPFYYKNGSLNNSFFQCELFPGMPLSFVDHKTTFYFFHLISPKYLYWFLDSLAHVQ